MKKILLLPLIITALIIPGFANPKTEESFQIEHIQAPPKSKFIDEVLSSYNEGKYLQFLKHMHDTYQKANDNWEYNKLLEERKKLSTIIQDFDSAKTSEFKKKMTALHEDENRELIDLCLSEPNCSLTRAVKDMVFFTPSQNEQESLNYLSNLSWKFKGDGKTPLENKLIEIDMEFWLKSLSLDLLVTQNKIDQETYVKQRTVLQLEKLKQMQFVTQEQNIDPKIKGYITTAQKIYPKVQAASITRKFLHDLAIGKVQPQNAIQEKMKAIAVKYHKKQQALTKEYFPEDQN